MPVTNQSVFDSASELFHTLADDVFADGVPGQWSTFADLSPTSAKTNTLNVLEAFPVVREWTGAKKYDDVHAAGLSLTVKQWEASFSIKRIDYVGDTSGQLGKRIGMWLNGASRFYDKIATDVLVSSSGAGPTGYDGVALYSASHPRGPAGATQSNLTASALSFSVHDAVLQAMASIRDAKGEPIGAMPNVMMCGPKNQKLAKEITQSVSARVMPT